MPHERVLIVDDNPGNLKLTRVLLQRHGFEVRTAADARSALSVLRSFAARLILLDLQLPGMDGFELARRLKSDPQTRHIVIVALTSYAMKGDAARARAAGCDDYVTKPFDTRALPARILAHLGRAPAPQRAPGLPREDLRLASERDDELPSETSRDRI